MRHLPALGFGVSGPHSTGLVPRRQTVQLIRQALDGGASLFDTAPFYGDGEAESRLGEALDGARDRAFIVSKAGTVRRGLGLAKDFSSAHLTGSVEASLRRLRTDWLDALLLHGPGPEHLNDGALETLERLKTDGKIRHTGVCGRGPEIEAAITLGQFDLIMAPAGPAQGDAARQRAAAARAAGISVLGIEIMAGAVSEWRNPRSPADLWHLARSARQRAAGMRAPASHPAPAAGKPLENLQWALGEHVCDCAVITTTRTQHLAANIAAAHGVRGTL